MKNEGWGLWNVEREGMGNYQRGEEYSLSATLGPIDLRPRI